MDHRTGMRLLLASQRFLRGYALLLYWRQSQIASGASWSGCVCRCFRRVRCEHAGECDGTSERAHAKTELFPHGFLPLTITLAAPCWYQTDVFVSVRYQ